MTKQRKKYTTSKKPGKNSKMSNEDRLLHLDCISREYLEGRIPTIEKYKELEQKYQIDYYRISLNNNNIFTLLSAALHKTLNIFGGEGASSKATRAAKHSS